jgi:hypothetical protein
MLDLCVIRTTYTDVFEGDPVNPDTSITLVEDLELHEAIDLCRKHGVSFAATGNQWAADPDGSHVIDYATGEVEEITIHPQGMWWPHEYEALVAGVDAKADSSLSFGYLVHPRSVD